MYQKKMRLFLVIFLSSFISGCTGSTPNLPKIKLPVSEDMANVERCLPAHSMSENLFKNFSETVRASALLKVKNMQKKRLLVLFYASQNGTWTVTLTDKDQISCVLLWGTDFEENKLGLKV